MTPREDEPVGPVVIDLVDQPYAAIRGHVSMQTVGAIADRIPELFDYLAERGIEPKGPPFLKYDVIGPGEELEIEAGVPVDNVAESAGDVDFAILRGGRFVTVSHHGAPDGLMDATAELLDWADEQDLRFDVDYVEEAEHWGARLEVYNSDPRELPDPDDWDTDLLFRLA